ncbi:expressed unknown protein [Seminavis robusta]|uniref:Transmembrane protein n=1 Tax=Seminavis robusta TaxID=568900 RepID=A0A9N8DHU1_9STRA|nr:expressed unknown protein [Seminavis robusta]|eukprot:Sro95_g049220.1 n/a (183) ;mRNA; f:33020-33568
MKRSTSTIKAASSYGILAWLLLPILLGTGSTSPSVLPVPVSAFCTPRLATRVATHSSASSSSSFLSLAKSNGELESSSDSSSESEEQVAERQRQLDAMMRNQEASSMQSSLLGLGTGTTSTSTGSTDDDDGDEYKAVPLFTGSVIFLFSLFFTFYGFYVFATGNDPIFLNVRPTEPPPASWY